MYAHYGARASLLVHLAGHLHRALLDLVATSPNLDPMALSVRFLGWVPRGTDGQDGAWRGRT
ncbi:hypothetical protein ACFP2T_01295 [Plantactinospora solaniradicis]|uniref:TetR family transcriptional regulator n=1 Tax=Plantactinospora solaniradicis TaxID=1723736 RepID=A0ABW1K1L3_9ACTN